jgi:hypothetical protein
LQHGDRAGRDYFERALFTCVVEIVETHFSALIGLRSQTPVQQGRAQQREHLRRRPAASDRLWFGRRFEVARKEPLAQSMDWVAHSACKVG